MDDCSPTHTFPNHHLHQSFHIVLPNHHSSEPGYSQPPLPLQCQEDQTISCFPTLDSEHREGINGEERCLLSTNSLDGDINIDGHLEGDERPSWYDHIQKDWDDNIESPTDDTYLKETCYRNDFVYNDARSVQRGKASYGGCPQLTYNRKANPSYVAKQAPFCRDGGHSSTHGGLDYRTDSVISDLNREDFGCSSGAREDQLQHNDASPWLSLPEENRWRGEASTLAPSVTSQKVGLNNRTYTQKLDSFSEAFLSQGKRRFPVITTADGPVWDNGIRPRLSCSFDSDSSSPSLPSFPSPPASNLLSPPPTPLPPASYSPSKVDSPGGLSMHTAAQGGEALGTLQFFSVRPQTLHPASSSGTIWKFPLLSQGFTALAGDSSHSEGNSRSCSGSNYGSSAAPHDVVQSLASSSSHLPAFQSSKPLRLSKSPSLNSFFHSSSHSALTSNHQNENSGPLNHKIQKGQTSLSASQHQEPGCPVYTGTTFPSMLQSKNRQKRSRYTPQPLLNPLRRGTGLYSSVCHRGEVCGEEEGEGCGILPCMNVGPEFQADIPPCTFVVGAEELSHDEDESLREQLLWKPWDEHNCSTVFEDQVEKLLQMSSSSCLPGGGTNSELALHCLHYCHGDIMATLELLLFSQPTPADDYHYPGTDVWTESEKSCFSAALEAYGKDFALIQIMVKTKTVAQCVEFYYLSKKLDEKHKVHKAEEESKAEEVEQPKRATPTAQPIARQIRLEDTAPVPSLASFFPCKLCGKMFYKIKSRNAHMKIHRQPQEDWTERKLQQQILNQALNRAPSLIVQPQTQTLTVSGTNSSSLSDSSILDHSSLLGYGNGASHVISSMDGGGQSSREATSVLQFQSLWGAFGHTSDPLSLYCNTDVKTETDMQGR